MLLYKENVRIPETKKEDDVLYLQFPELEKTGCVKHLFTTREGGCSQGMFSSMNLSFTRGDDKSRVEENFRRIAKILNCEIKDMVATDQTHTTNVRCVTKADAGHGIVRKKDFFDTDGLVTKEPGIVLAAFFADCVPLYFVDPVKKAIGLSHSGWKGTLYGIGEQTVRVMTEKFGSDPKDIVAAIGPSICADCYEVGEDVKELFVQEFIPKYYPDEVKDGNILSGNEITENITNRGSVLSDCGNGKYRLDLWLANRYVLQKAGVLPEHISCTGLCTCCNREVLFSHRGSDGKRGNLGAFLGLKE